MSNKYINNYIFVSVNTVASLILPIISFPYVSRVLGVESIGLVSFVTSYGYYFMHFASFGINSYAIREVSRLRDNFERLNIVTKEIYSLNVLFSFLSGFFYLTGVFVVPKFREHWFLFFIYSLTVFTNFLVLEWLFQAFDDFQFATIRGIIIRLASIIAVFIFVKDSSDYTLYMLILTISEMGSRFSNLYYARKKYVKLQFKKRFLNFRSHIKQLSILFVFRLVNGISANLDKLMIGFMLVYSDVGIYSVGIKFILLIVPLVENIGIVLFPKINISMGANTMEYKKILELNYNYILLLGIPMAIGLFLLLPKLIILFSGVDFLDSILVSRIMCIVIVLCPLGDLLGSKILLVYKKDTWLLVASIIVAMSNIILNFLFIPLWGVLGATIASVLSYVVAVIVRFILSRRLIKFSFFSLKLLKYSFFTIPFVILYIFCNELINSNTIYFLLFICIAISIYLFELFISRDKEFMLIFNKILKKGN